MGIGKDVVDNAADKAKQAAKNVAKEYAKKIGGLLLKNPYFWIVVAILFIEIVIVGTFAEIESNAGNDTDDYLTGSSDEQWEQFIRFIAYMEGGNTIYKNSKGQDCYMVINDTLVGLDMTFGGYRGYFQELGYDTSEGALIPVEDAVQKREEDIENKYYNYIDSHTSEYSLTQYQKFALTSRAFNHGSEGALYTAYGNENFMDAYKNYWKQSRDDKFKKTKEPDLNHKLYTRAMNKTVSGVINGVYYPYLEGLDRRRQAEFRLFQCGWYYWAGCMDEQFIEESYGGSGGAESGAAGDPPRHLERIRAHRTHPRSGLPPGDHLGRVQRKSQPLCQPAAFPRRAKGRQGGHTAHELPGMAARLFRHPEGGRFGGAAQFPLRRRRDRILHQPGRGGRAHLRTGVHRPRGGDRRAHHAGPPPHLPGHGQVPQLCRGLRRAVRQLRL